jgi:hypothetical protein
VYYVVGRGLGFFYDEWDFILGRRGWSAGAFLDSHGGHPAIVPVLIYKALWATFGLRHYGPYRLTLAGLHLLCVTLLFVLVRRRVGSALALVAAVSLAFLGPAWQDLIWAFQIGFLGSMAAGLGALIALERPSVRGDVIAAVLLTVSLACSGLGLPFLAAAGVDVLIKRRSWRRLSLVTAPALMFGLWYLRYGENPATSSNIPALPRYVFDSLSGALAAISSGGGDAGKWLAILALVSLAVALALGRPFLSALPFATIALAFWILTALSRAQLHEPSASRYLYVGAVGIILFAAELMRGFRFPSIVVVALSAAVAVASFHNLRTLRDAAAGLRANDVVVNTELTVVELERSVVALDFRPDVQRAPQITAGPYLAAVDELGSPALPASALRTGAPSLLAEADNVLVRAVAPILVSRGGRSGSAEVRVDGFSDASFLWRPPCLIYRPNRSSRLASTVDVVVPASGLMIESARKVDIFVRRFAPAYPTQPSMKLAAGRSVIRPPRDTITLPWRVRIASTGQAKVCAAT